MTKKIPIEKQAFDILNNYKGNNNFIKNLKYRIKNNLTTMGRSNALYIIQYHDKPVYGFKKKVKIDDYYAEALKKTYYLSEKPKEIYIHKILVQKEKAIHVWGKIEDTQNLMDFWVPKNSIIQETKVNKVEFHEGQFDKYERQPMPHQLIGIKRLLQYDRFILADDMGLGKCEFVDNKVFTPLGRKRIGDIKVGDYVIGSNGKPTLVEGVFPQGKKELYRVTFNDGYSVLVGGEHLWSVTSSNGSKNNKNREIRYTVLTTNQMLDKDLSLEQIGTGWNKKRPYKFKTYYKLSNGNNKWQIPIVKPIEFGRNQFECLCGDGLPINPYLLGVSLGDGYINKVGNIKIEVHKDDFDEIFNNQILNEGKQQQNKRVNNINTLKEEIKSLKLNGTLSHTKFIPDIYKYSSIDDRLALLQGLMDTDGYCMKAKNGEFAATEYCTVSEQLADDVAEVVHSLGGIVRKHSKIGSYKKPDGTKIICKRVFRLNIKLPSNLNPFRLKRKADLYKSPQKYKVGRYIKNIEFEKEDEAVCIQVSSPDHLYVTEHGIVTHNTYQTIVSAIESGCEKILIVCPASLKLNWKKEIVMCGEDPDDIVIISGSGWIPGFKWTIINYDILKNFHTIRDKRKKEQKLNKHILNENFDLIIGDEAHYLKNKSAGRTKLFNDFSNNNKKLWLLTGTPITNRPIDYYNLLHLTKAKIANNWLSFVKRYCDAKQFYGKGGRRIWDTKGASNLDELRENTKDVILRRRKEEVLDLPDKIIQPIYQELENKKEYQKIVGEYQDWLEHKKEVTLALQLAKLVELRQFLAMEKLKSTIQLAESAIEEDRKVIIFTNFTQPLLELQKHFGNKCVIHHGKMNKNSKEYSVEEFQTNKNIKVFIGNIVSAGVGITLTEGDLVIFNDLSWLPADHLQAQDRSYRIGQKNTVNVYYNIIDETLDLNLFEALMKKMKVIDDVMGDNAVDDNLFKEVIGKLKK